MTVKHLIWKFWNRENHLTNLLSTFTIIFFITAMNFLNMKLTLKILEETFQYPVHISENPHELDSFKPIPAYLGVRASKSEMDKAIVPSYPLSIYHQTNLAPRV